MLPTTVSLLKVIHTTIADFALKLRADTKAGTLIFFPVGVKNFSVMDKSMLIS